MEDLRQHGGGGRTPSPLALDVCASGGWGGLGRGGSGYHTLSPTEFSVPALSTCTLFTRLANLINKFLGFNRIGSEKVEACNSHGQYSLGSKERIASSIFVSSQQMLLAIDFNAKHCFWTLEVEIVRADGELAAKAKAEFFLSQNTPDNPFRNGHLAPVASSCLLVPSIPRVPSEHSLVSQNVMISDLRCDERSDCKPVARNLHPPTPFHPPLRSAPCKRKGALVSHETSARCN